MNTHVIRGADETHCENGVEYKHRDYVASTWGGPNEANARLMAAAPDLLAAVIAICEQADKRRDKVIAAGGICTRAPEAVAVYELAMAAIAKATL